MSNNTTNNTDTTQSTLTNNTEPSQPVNNEPTTQPTTSPVKSTSPQPTKPIVSLSDAALALASASTANTTVSNSTTTTSITDSTGNTTTKATHTTALPITYAQPAIPTTSPQRYTLRQPALSHSISNSSINSLHSQHSTLSANKLSTLGTAAKTIDEIMTKPLYTLQQQVVEPVEETIVVDTTEPLVDPSSSVVVLDEVIRQEVVRCVCGKVHIEPINPTVVEAASTDPNSNLADPNQPVTNDNVSDAVVQCEGCLIWQHARCVGLTSLDSIPQEYYCDLCQPDSAIHQTRLKYEQMLMKLTPSKSSSVKTESINGTSPTKLTPSKRQSYEISDNMSVDSNESNKHKQAKQEPTDRHHDKSTQPLETVQESNGNT